MYGHSGRPGVARVGKGRRGIPSGKSDLANIAVSGLITAKLPDERYARIIPHKKSATPPAINRGPVIVCAGSLTNKSLSPARTRSAPNIFFPNANILAFSFAVTRVSLIRRGRAPNAQTPSRRCARQ